MKQIFLTLLILASLHGVTQIKVYSYDFENLKPKYDTIVSYKHPIQIQLRNINRKIYKVEDAVSSEDFNVTLPDALKGIKLPTFIFNAPSPTMSSDEAKEAGFNEPDVSILKDIDKIVELLVNGVQSRANRINEAVLFYNDIGHIAKNCADPSVTIVSLIKSKTIAFLYHKSVDPYSREALSSRLLDTLKFQPKNAKDNVIELKKDIDRYSKQMGEVLDEPIQGAQKNISENEEKLAVEKNATTIKEMKKKIVDKNKSLATYNLKKQELNKAVAEMEEKLKSASDIVANMAEFEKDDKLYAIYAAFQIYVNPKNYKYYSAIIIPDKDQVKLSLTITPKDLNECTAPDKRTTEIKLKVKGGLKVDVSTGVFFNFGDVDFLGNTFYYQKIDVNARKIITAKRNNNLMLSVGALLHIYKRSPAVFKLAGSVGVSTTSDFTDLNFHAGPSLIIGNENRFIFTAGITLKSSKVLARQLGLNTPYQMGDTPDDIPTVSVFPTVGWFIGGTYSFNIFK